MARLSVELEQFFLTDSEQPTVTLQDILTLAGERTFGFLFVLLSLPSALPIPAPGYSIPFGAVILLLAVQLMGGRQRPWLPDAWQQRGFNRSQVQGIVQKGLPWLRRLEILCRPRYTPICTTGPGRFVIGSAIALMAIAMLIPIPGTNTLPAMGIFVTGFGLVDDDGLISVGGLTLCGIAFCVVVAILLGGYEGLKFLVQWLIPGG